MEEKIIVAVDASNPDKLNKLVELSKAAGALAVKFGTEAQSASSWGFCADLAQAYDIDWVADAKLHDIPNTVKKTVANLCQLERPPIGITAHIEEGNRAMLEVAQEQAGLIKILGVTALTSIDPEDYQERYGRRLSDLVEARVEIARQAGIGGLVASPLEVGRIRANPDNQHFFAMIPGIRPAGSQPDDQARTGTPSQAIRDGADLLVIGRPIHGAADPGQAFKSIVAEIEGVKFEPANGHQRPLPIESQTN